ncbi:MAG TPA: hypothetical protein GX392_00685 [Clostridiales bacterium]|nr:hypothetical protein [Clostridiales bacterium]
MKNLNAIQKTYYSCKSRFDIIKNDIKSDNNLGFFKRLKMWQLGFLSEKYYLYNLEHNNFRDYLSDHNHEMSRFINQPYNVILDDKIIFEKIISQYIRVPKNYALIDNGNILPLQSKVKINDIDSLIYICKKESGLVIKPVRGSQGRGVKILHIKNNVIFKNGKEIKRQELENIISNLDNFIITEFIEQGQYSRNLYPGSTNTIRVVAMMDPHTHKPFIAGAAQRIGGKASGGLDNFAQGGYSANIDLNSGELSAAVTRLETENLIWHNKHPDTDSQIKGVKIPGWHNIKHKLLCVMEELPYIKYVGWDIVLTDDDIVVIEGNSYPQPRVIQIHTPLLKNDQVKEFYKYYSII